MDAFTKHRQLVCSLRNKLFLSMTKYRTDTSRHEANVVFRSAIFQPIKATLFMALQSASYESFKSFRAWRLRVLEGWTSYGDNEDDDFDDLNCLRAMLDDATFGLLCVIQRAGWISNQSQQTLAVNNNAMKIRALEKTALFRVLAVPYMNAHILSYL
jgi:hypothetical protein